MVRIDLRYAGSRSFWMDLKILAKTAGVVLKYSEDLQVLRAAGFAAAAGDD